MKSYLASKLHPQLAAHKKNEKKFCIHFIHVYFHTVLATILGDLRRVRLVSVSVFVGLISTHITNQFLNILVYSSSEFQVLQEYTKIFKNRLILSVNIKSSKTETGRLKIVPSTVCNVIRVIAAKSHIFFILTWERNIISFWLGLFLNQFLFIFCLI